MGAHESVSNGASSIRILHSIQDGTMLLSNWLFQVRDGIRSSKRNRNSRLGTRRSNLPAGRPCLVETLEQRVYLSGVDSGEALAHGIWQAPAGYEGTYEDSHAGHEFEEFVLHGTQWPQPGGAGSAITITYSYSNLFDGGLAGGLTTDQLRATMEESLAVWAAVAPLNFVEVVDSGPPVSDTNYPPANHPQIRIGHHFIDGDSGVLAHAYYPNDTTTDGFGGDLHFDNGETWTLDPNTGIHILPVAVHELGHSLGIGHEPAPPNGNQAIMNPIYDPTAYGPGLGNAFLFQDDINAIRAIYGTGVGSVTPIGGGGGEEPTDDHGNSAFLSTHIEVPSLTAGVIETSRDPDWFNFDAQEGVAYVFEVKPGSLPDSTLTLVNRNGVSVIAFDDNGGTNMGSRIEWTAPVTGTFYLKVEPFSSNQIGSYELEVAQAAIAAKPTLLSPIGTTTDLQPQFEWTPAAGAIRYELWVLDLTGGGTAIHNTDIDGLRYVPTQPMEGGHTYRVRVRGISNNGTPGEFSDPIDFSISAVNLTPPNLVSFPQGATNSTLPIFEWTEVAGAAQYDLWVNDMTAGQSGVIRQKTLTEPTFTPTVPLIAGHNYIWTVRAIHENGVTSEFAAHRTFTVTANLTTPIPLAPAGTVAGTTQTFSWTSVDGAAFYDLWVNNLTTGELQVIRNQAITGTSYTDTDSLRSGNSYVWAVRAIDSNSLGGSFSDPVTFSVSSLIGVPRLEAPIGEVEGTTQTFRWSSVAGIAKYDLWVNDVTTGQSQVIRNKNITDTTLTDSTTLQVGHTYNWAVRATDSAGNSGLWSEIQYFSVAITVGTPTALSPIGTTNTTSPTFRWTAVAEASHYDLWVNNLTTGVSGVVRQKDVEGTSFTAAGLVNGDSYLWTVRAIHATGNAGEFAAHKSFTISTTIGAPTLIGPTGTIFNQTPTFEWNAVAGAIRYELFVTLQPTDSGNPTTALHRTNLTSTSYTPTTPLVSGDYHWWVRAIGSSGTPGRWSAPGEFKVSGGALTDREMPLPLHQEDDQLSNPVEDVSDELIVDTEQSEPSLVSDQLFADLNSADGLPQVLYGDHRS